MFGYTMKEALGVEGTHESVHASDLIEIDKDIKSANGGLKREKDDYEYKARKTEQEYRNELMKQKEER